MAINKKRILFVDDEKKELNKIKALLSDMFTKWEMVFEESCEKALNMDIEVPFDIVVSDEKMPEMEGENFLKEVKKRYPTTICFLMLEAQEKAEVIHHNKTVNQFLSKNIDAETLKETITNALDSLNLVSDDQFRQVVAQIDTLPALPDLFVRVEEEIKKPMSSAQSIASIINQDLAVTTKILRLVNSAHFGIKSQVTNIKDAVTFLGIETIKAIILTTESFNHFNEQEVKKFDIHSIYDHSIQTGVLASKVMSVITKDRTQLDAATMAGMIHDIGKLVFIQNFQDKYFEVLTEHKNSGRPLHEVEKEMLDGVTHAEVGGYLIGVWGLPEMIVKAVSMHHKAIKALGSLFNVSSSVYIANMFLQKTEPGVSRDKWAEADNDYLVRLGVKKHLPEWTQLAEASK